jgi:hypothetical protein
VSSEFYVAFTVHFCLIEQFIPTDAHRHIMSIVSFISSFPQYVFRRAYIAIIRGSLKFFKHRPIFIKYIVTAIVMYKNVTMLYIVTLINIVTLLYITMAVTMYFINIGLC